MSDGTDITLTGPGPVSVSFDCPDYDPFPWTRRAVILVGGDRSVTVEDMGVTVKDIVMKLGCREPTLTTDNVLQLYKIWFQQGAVCTLTDWAENAFDVFFRAFHPKPYVGDRWSYDMELIVLSVTKLLGQSAILPV
jgi:hypothetical protein